MCGIAGVIDFRGVEIRKSTIKIMTDAIKHRGPDGEGQWVYENVGLGHRRLSIIDLSNAASQPMLSADERYVLSYNGEIYNYKEIRNELIGIGEHFSTSSDSEVLLKSLIIWGSDALVKFNGMFTFAFYDTVNKEMILGRDRYGIKPLYYSLQDSYFSFSSEQKAIKINSGFISKFDEETLVEYMTFQNIFTDKTFEKDIRILPAGHYIRISSSKPSLPKPVQYWDYHFVDPINPASDNEYIEELDRLFKQAVGRTLVGDVEIGSYLSGGIDSGSVTSIASKYIKNLKTFTVGFDLSSASGIELNFDERINAEKMSAQFKTEHYEIVLKAGDMERCIHKLMYHLEEPRVGQSYPNLYAAKLASKWVKVVLSGAGGDELFGGYPWRYYLGDGSKDFNAYVDGYYGYWQRLVDNESLRKLLSPIQSEVSSVWTKDIFRNVLQKHPNDLSRSSDFVNNSLYFEAKTFLHGLFVVEDKLSMAYGLETRVPFMDNDLVDFAMNLPSRLKVSHNFNHFRIDENTPLNKKETYFARTNDGKKILRQVMSRHIPEEVTLRPKQGFSSPDASWFRGESIDFVKKRLLNKANPIYTVIDYPTASMLIEQHLNGLHNRRLLIWSLLSLTELMEN
jgi:asparagine synthase (glutamine-hydrolysing)